MKLTTLELIKGSVAKDKDDNGFLEEIANHYVLMIKLRLALLSQSWFQ